MGKHTYCVVVMIGDRYDSFVTKTQWPFGHRELIPHCLRSGSRRFGVRVGESILIRSITEIEQPAEQITAIWRK